MPITIGEVIANIRSIKPSEYEDATLVRWLSDLDGQIYNDVISWHEGADSVAHGPYTADLMDTILLVPSPYTDIYMQYLKAQIDSENAEVTRYNNDMLMFNMTLRAFSAHYNRTHMPKQDHYFKGVKP